MIEEDTVRPTWATVRTLAAEVERLKLELELTREENLSSIEDMNIRLKMAFRLSATEGAVLGRLWRGRLCACVTHEQLFASIVTRENEDNADIVKVYVCKVRSKVGFPCIETVWGRGYRLTDEAIARITSILQPQQGRAA